MRLDELREPVRSGKTGRPGADDHDVDVEGFPFHSRQFGHAMRSSDTEVARIVPAGDQYVTVARIVSV